MGEHLHVGGWRTRICGAGVVLGCLAACGAAGERRGRPLYPTPAQPLARSEVAVLSGYVAEVDGEDVSDETGSFELLPGCHVVRTPSEWGVHDAESVMVAETGVVPFALTMKGGYAYEVRVRTSGPTAPSGTFIIEAVETDPQGNPAGRFDPVTQPADLERCAE